MQLLTDGHDIYARTDRGEFFNLLKEPTQPLLVVGNEGLAEGAELDIAYGPATPRAGAQAARAPRFHGPPKYRERRNCKKEEPGAGRRIARLPAVCYRVKDRRTSRSVSWLGGRYCESMTVNCS